MKILKKWWFWVIAVVIVVAVAGGTKGTDSKKDDGNKNPTGTTTEQDKNKDNENKDDKKDENKVNYDNFLKVTMGMKYEEAVEILGEGKMSTSSEVSGIKTAIYSWNGSGISNMNISVQNGLVIGKAQSGLGKKNTKITLEKYNGVKEGMTYEEVKAILGEDGQLTSQSKIMTYESSIYSWINKDGKNMNCTFSENKMKMKAQFGLQ